MKTLTLPKDFSKNVAACCILFCFCYWQTLAYLAFVWRSDEEYSHGFLVVPVSLWILYRRRNDIPTSIDGLNLGGIWLLGLAAMMRIISARFYLPEFDAWSIPIAVFGMIWLMAGWDWVKWSLPAIAYLWMMTRIPATLELALSFPLQKLAASLSTQMLQTFGFAAFNQGTIIEMPAGQVNVREACSGLKMFMSTIAVAVGFVLLTLRRWLPGLLIIGSVVPIAILSNVLRIVATALLYELTDDVSIRQVFHDTAGLLMIGFSLGILVLVVYGVERLVRYVHDDSRRIGGAVMVTGFSVAAVLAVYLGVHRVQWNRLKVQMTADAHDAMERRDWERAEQLLLRLSTAFGDRSQQNSLARVYLESGQPLTDGRLRFVLDTGRRTAGQDLSFLAEIAEIAARADQHQLAYDLSEKGLQVTNPQAGDPVDLQLRLINVRSLNALLSHGQPLAVDWRTLSQRLISAIQLTKTEPDLFYQLAFLHRNQLKAKRTDSAQYADDWIRQMFKHNGQNPLAYFGRYDYRRRYPNTQLNEEIETDLNHDLDRAIQLSEGTSIAPAILYAAAKRAIQRREFVLASEWIDQLRDRSPNSSLSYLLNSELLSAQQNTEAAGSELEEGMRRIGVQLDLAIAYVQHLVGCDRETEANSFVKRALNELPDSLATGDLFRLSMADSRARKLAAKGKFVEAVNQLLPSYQQSDRVIVNAKLTAEYWYNLATYASAALMPELAMKVWQRTIQLNPDYELKPPFLTTIQSIDAMTARQFAENPEDPAVWRKLAQLLIQRNAFLPKHQRDWSSFLVAMQKLLAQSGDQSADLNDEVLMLQYYLLDEKKESLRTLISKSSNAHMVAQHAAKKYIESNPRLAIEFLVLAPDKAPHKFSKTIDAASFFVLNHALLHAVKVNQQDTWNELTNRWLLGPKTAGSIANIASIRIDWLTEPTEQKIRSQLGTADYDPFKCFTLGNLEFAKRNYHEAKSNYTQGLQIAPRNVSMRNNLALCEFELQQFEVAKSILEEALSLAPDDDHLAQSMALCELALGMHQKALDRLSGLLESNSVDLRKINLYLAVANHRLQNAKPTRHFHHRFRQNLEREKIGLSQWEEARFKELEAAWPN